MTSPHVLIVDDHWISASGLSALVMAAIPGATCVICSSIAEVQQRLSSFSFLDMLVVSDFWLPDGTALSLLELLALQSSPSRVIIMSGDDNPELVRKVAEAGAWAFSSKASSADELLQLIRLAMTDAPSPLQRTLPQGETEKMSNHTETRPALVVMTPTELGLTPRQGDVLRNVLAGRPNKGIARQLGIGEQTVKEHVSVLLAHFNAENRIALIRQFAERRITVSD